jgi:hypothetical protein
MNPVGHRKTPRNFPPSPGESPVDERAKAERERERVLQAHGRLDAT